MYFIRLKKINIVNESINIGIDKKAKKSHRYCIVTKIPLSLTTIFLSLLSGGSGYLIGYLCFRAFEFGFSSITILFHLFCLFVFGYVL